MIAIKRGDILAHIDAKQGLCKENLSHVGCALMGSGMALQSTNQAPRLVCISNPIRSSGSMTSLHSAMQSLSYTDMPNPTTNQVRIIGGSLRSRKISFPDAEGLRPTTDRIRETLFNWLQFDLQSKHCLDLFAGSGVLGIEALSRGAASCVFIEKNAAAANSIGENLKQLELASGNVYCADALQWFNSSNNNAEKFDLIFIDPPFSSNYIEKLFDELDSTQRLAANCKLYIESPVPLAQTKAMVNWQQVKTKKAGKVHFSLWRLNANNKKG
jgi:16S rRNA (guanine966-N2)-methyltransferase